MSRDRVSRREWCAAMFGMMGGAAVVGLAHPAKVLAFEAPIKLTVYKDPSCGCCTKWIAHLKANGFEPTAKDRGDMDALKDSLGVPAGLRSCHTAVAGKFVIEGHVPAADVKKLLSTAPKGVLGIAVPGMPAGSPGMEVPGRSDKYDVIAFAPGGKTHGFASHG
jgi:hypothetical protein